MDRPPLAVVVASVNPVKRQAAEEAVGLAFPGRELTVEALDLPSGVAAQPMSEGETRRGAEGRVRAAQEARPGADLWLGIEGGVEEMEGGLAAFAWVVARGWSRTEGRARSATFFLPPGMAELVRAGVELGEASDRLFGRTGSKRGAGAVGLLTGGAVDRLALYRQPVVLALIPFREPALRSD